VVVRYRVVNRSFDTPTERKRTMRTMRTAGASALLVGLALVLLPLPACSPPALPTITDQTPASPGVHLLIDGDKSLFYSEPSNHIFVVALDARTGHVIWRHQLASAANEQVMPVTVSFQPFVSGHLAFVTYTLLDGQTGDEHGTLDALDLTSGQLRWRHEAGSRLLGVVIVGSAVYLSSVSVSHDKPGSEVVEALDRQSGRLHRSRPLLNNPAGPQVPALAVSGDKVFVIDDPYVSDGGRLVALKASDGSLLWNYTSPMQLRYYNESIIGNPAVISNQLVYVDAEYPDNGSGNSGGDNSGSLLVLNADDGKVAWQHNYGAGFPSILNQSGGILCLRESQPYPANGYTTTKIVGLDAKTGQTRWSVPIDGGSTDCVAGGDSFYISVYKPGDSSSSIVALASNDGHQLWHSHSTPTLQLDTTLTPWVAHGFVGQIVHVPPQGINSMVMVHYADSGALAWQHEFHTLARLPRVEGGQIYIATSTSTHNPPDTLIVTALSLSTGARLWTYEIGRL
jgi:outer membrane protein assembly factor BamB